MAQMASGRSGSPGVCFVIILLLGILAVALSLSQLDRQREGEKVLYGVRFNGRDGSNGSSIGHKIEAN